MQNRTQVKDRKKIVNQEFQLQPQLVKKYFLLYGIISSEYKFFETVSMNILDKSKQRG